MKSFAQLAKVAYNAWHQSHGTDKHQVPFEKLDAEDRAHWVEVAKAIAQEVAPLH